MLLTESEKAKWLRSRMLDIVIAVINAERRMISDSLSSVFLRYIPSAHEPLTALSFSPIVYMQDDSLL